MHDVLRFWLDRGVDGFRADVVHCIGKDPALPDDPPEVAGIPHSALNDVPVTHQRLRAIRSLLDSYPGDRVMVGEVYLLSTSAVATYYGKGDQLHLAFNFPPLYALWQAERWRECIAETVAAPRPKGRLAHLGAVQPRQPAPPDPLRPGGGVAGGGPGHAGAAERGESPSCCRPRAHPAGNPLPLPRRGARAHRRGGASRASGRPGRPGRVPGAHPLGRQRGARVADDRGAHNVAALPARSRPTELRRPTPRPRFGAPPLSATVGSPAGVPGPVHREVRASSMRATGCSPTRGPRADRPWWW